VAVEGAQETLELITLVVAVLVDCFITQRKLLLQGQPIQLLSVLVVLVILLALIQFLVL
jgi:hypothetical protein